MVKENKMVQTEIGLVSEDWVLETFGDCLEGFSSGMTPYRGNKEYYKGDFPWVTSGELNYNIITDTIEKITPLAIKNTNLKVIPKGTFLMAITGLEAEGTRGSCAITGIKATTNQSCMALYPKKNKITTSFLYHYYVAFGNELALKYCQGTKQQSYNAVTAKKLPICYPKSLPEQEAIAEALSDADAWIESLEQLIAKKRLIKQGAMQELLLPKEDWEEKTIFEIADKKRDLFNDGDWIEAVHIKEEGIRLIQTGNIGVGRFLNRNNKKYISEKSFFDLKCKEILEGDLLICRLAEPAGRVCIFPKTEDLKSVTSVDVTIYRPDENIFDRRILLYLLSTDEWFKQVLEQVGGTTHKRISRGNLGKIKIKIPNSLSEQTRIATILSDMDAELEALEAQLGKARKVKQGMMQELLTGRVRLV